MLKLTAKQQLFVDEYLIDLNATAAARRAGYSKKTAQVIGAENLSKPMVADAIAEAQAERAERLRIDADWVLTRLVEEVEADLADLFTDDGALKPIKGWPTIWRQGLVAGLDTREIFADDQKVGQVTKLRLSDRIRRLELIGKHIGVTAFADRTGAIRERRAKNHCGSWRIRYAPHLRSRIYESSCSSAIQSKLNRCNRAGVHIRPYMTPPAAADGI